MNSHFWVGFEKKAGLFQRAKDALKGLVTGKKYLYHGTTPQRYEKIMREGIKPQNTEVLKDMVPDYNKHTWVSTDLDEARHYANQRSNFEDPRKSRQIAISLAKRFAKAVNFLTAGKKKDLIQHKAKTVMRDIHKGGVDLVTSHIPTKQGKVIQIEIPKEDFLKMKSPTNPASEAIKSMGYKGSPSTEIAIKGEIPPKYFKRTK